MKQLLLYTFSLASICVFSSCQANDRPLDAEAQYCGFAEPVRPTRTNIWDKYSEETRVGERCVTLHHPEGERYEFGTEVCVLKSQIQEGCGNTPGIVCMAPCEGRFVDRLSALKVE